MATKNQPTGMTYRIAHVKDFLNVPAKRRAACLKDFRLWVRLVDAGAQFIDAIAPEAQITPDDFVWTDDGIDGANRMTIRDKDGNVLHEFPSQNPESGAP